MSIITINTPGVLRASDSISITIDRTNYANCDLLMNIVDGTTANPPYLYINNNNTNHTILAEYRATATTIKTIPNNLYTLTFDASAINYINTHHIGNGTQVQIRCYSSAGEGQQLLETTSFTVYADEEYTGPTISNVSTTVSPSTPNNTVLKGFSTVTLSFTALPRTNISYIAEVKVNDLVIPVTISGSYTVTFNKCSVDSFVISITDNFEASATHTVNLNTMEYTNCALYCIAHRKHTSPDIIDVNLQTTSTSSWGVVAPGYVLKYRYKVGSGSYSAYTIISNPNVNGDNTFTINSPRSAGAVTIEAVFTDAFTTATFTFNADSQPPIFYLNNEEFNLTVPLYLTNDSYCLYINGVDIDTYIRSIS